MIVSILLSLALQVPDAQIAPPDRPGDASLPEGHVHEILHLVSIEGSPLELLRLARLDLDTVRASLAEGEVEILADDADLAAIRELGLTATVKIEDLAAHYARRLSAGALDAPDESSSRAPGPAAPYGQWLTA